jgi:hypothetical protein
MKKSILIILIIAITAFILGKCSAKPVPTESDNQVIDSLETVALAYQIKSDSLKKVAIKDSLEISRLKTSDTIYVNRYYAVKEKYRNDTICPETVKELTNACDSSLMSKDSVIYAQTIRDSTLTGIIKAQDKQIEIKDSITSILKTNLAVSTNKVETLQKKVKRNRVIAGVITGIAAIEAAFILLVK